MPHANSPMRKVQQSSFRKHARNTDCNNIFNLLTSPELFDQIEILLPAHRERLFPPTETLSMFVAQVLSQDRSCQHIVNQAVAKSLVSGSTPGSTHTGGYCKARQRLPLDMPKELAAFIAKSLEKETPSSWRWHGRRLRVVDGTTATMPDTEENQRVYPQLGSQKTGVGFPICRLLAVMDLCSGAVLDMAFGRFKGKGTDEQTLLRSVSGIFESGDIVLGDAFFSSYLFIAEMLEKGVDILMEQYGARRRTTDFRRGISLGGQDHIIEISKPAKKPDWIEQARFDAIPNTIAVREFKVNGKIIVTTLIDVKIHSKRSLFSLYKRRWEIETNLGQIKTILGMNILSCKTPEMISKEIWVYILAYNLIRLLMAQSAQMTKLRPTDLSFKHCLQLWLNYLQQTATMDRVGLETLFTLMAQQRVAKRPGRIEPRVVKRRPKPYPMMTKSRAQSRESIRVNGHPKKLK